LIIGTGNSPVLMESLNVGCVTLSSRFFSDGIINRQAMEAANLEAQLEFAPKVHAYRLRGWQRAIGASGTLLAINKMLAANGWSSTGITLAGARRLCEAVIAAGHIDRLRIDGLSQDRARILPGGLAIMLAAMESLAIDRFEISDGALREGLLYDLVGRHSAADVRDASIRALASRYHVDEAQAQRLQPTVLHCLSHVAEGWRLDEEECARWLKWAAHLHEIGLDIAHDQHQKHGAYVLAHADLAGFSFQEQQLLSVLVLTHRRKLSPKAFKEVRSHWGKKIERLAILLRLAALLHRSRSAVPLPAFTLEGDKKHLALHMPPGWLQEHLLTRADLQREAKHLTQIGVTLAFD
jgi:exopolyphosphatase/guanosine-5'-triphosphate,3'-diphosphate pyrophosphatase